MTRPSPRSFLVRDDGRLLALLDRRMASERAEYPGRRVTREGLVREILYASLKQSAKENSG